MIAHVDRLRAAVRFLADLFGQAPEGAHLLIWTIDERDKKTSHWFTDSDEAAAFAVSPACDSRRVYVGCGFHNEALGEHERGREDHIAGLVGLWADIDVAGQGHDSPKTYPPTADAARALLAELPLAPSLVVDTGGGLHAWWLFHEPLEIDTGGERAAAKQLTTGWGATIQAAARAHGWEIDSVWDLTRVLRIPGTYRNKGGDRSLATRGTDNVFPIPRFNASDFEPFLTAAEVPSAQPAPRGEIQAVPKRGAQPPAMKFMALAMNEPRFADTFGGRRRDMKDNSQSGHDQSMANFAAAASWTDQEIADLLMASREQNGANPDKALRLDYLKRVIDLARSSIRSDEIDRELNDIAEVRKLRERERQLERERQVQQIIETLATGQPSQKVLGELSILFGIGVKAIVQYGRDEARYSIKTDRGEISLGRVENLTNQDRFRSRLVEAVQRAIPLYKKNEWIDVTNTMLSVCDVVEDDDATRAGELRSWIAALVTSTRRWLGEQYEGALVEGHPFFLEGSIHVHAQALSVYVKSKLLEQTTARDICDRLRGAGFVRRQITGRPFVEGKRKHFGRSYWAAPIEFLGAAYGELIPLSFLQTQTQNPKDNPQENEDFTN